MIRLALLTLALLLALAPTGARAEATADDLLRDDAGVLGGGLAPYRVAETGWDPDRIRFLLAAEGAPSVELVLRAAGSTDAPAHRTRWYDVAVTASPPGDARADALIAAVLARIGAQEEGGPRLRQRPSTQGEQAAVAPSTVVDSAHGDEDAAGPMAAFDLWLCFGLLVLSFGFVPALSRQVRGDLWDDAPAAARVALLAVFTLAVAAHTLVPWRLVMVFHGYPAVAEAWSLRPVLKYGAATTALYGPLLRAFGPSTGVVIATNVIFGLLTLPLLAVLARRLAGHEGPRAGLTALVALALVGLSPVLVSDHATESILVPTRFWLAAALVLLDGWARTGRRLPLAGAVVFAALVVHARPDTAAMMPLLAGAVLLAARPLPPLRLLAVAAGILAAVALPRVLELVFWMPAAVGRGDLPGLVTSHSPSLSWLVERNLLLLPMFHALSVTALAAVAVTTAPRGLRAARLAVAFAVAGWVVLSMVDLPWVSIPRVQAPAAEWACVLAAAPVARLLAHRRLLPLGAALLALALVPAPRVVETLWARTNPQEFDAFWRTAAPGIPATDRPLCIAALGGDDEPRSIAFRRYPLVELLDRAPSVRGVSLGELLRDGDWLVQRCDLLYLRAPQCNAMYFPAHEPTPPLFEHPACRAAEEAFARRPLAEVVAPNHGSPDLTYWGYGGPMRYGIYRITGRNQAARPPTPRLPPELTPPGASAAPTPPPRRSPRRLQTPR